MANQYVEYDGRLRRKLHVNLGHLIQKVLKARPDFIGQVEEETGRISTFQEMREKSVKCALWLEKNGIRSRDVVAICTNNHFDAYIPYFGCLYINAIASPWDIRLARRGNLSYFMKRCQPKVIFINGDMADAANEAALKLNIFLKIVVFNEFNGFTSLETCLNEITQVEVNTFECRPILIYKRRSMMLLFTSGTTGFPKCVKINHSIFTIWSNHQPVMFPYDIGLWFSPLSCIMGVLLTVRAVLFCVTAIKYPRSYHPESLCEMIHKYKVSWVFLETDMLHHLVDSLDYYKQKYNLSSLRQIVFGGSRISNNIDEKLITTWRDVSVIQIYYLTETSIVAFQRPIRGQQSTSSIQAAENVRLKIVSSSSCSCCPMVGEIYCKTIYMMSGYYNNLPASRRVMDNGWFRTGDYGSIDRNGNITVIDHIEHIITCQGHGTSPYQVEQKLALHPLVSNVLIVPFPYLCEMHLMAFIEREDPDDKIEKQDLFKLIEGLYCADLADAICKKLRFWIVEVDIPRLFSAEIDPITLIIFKKNCILL